MARYTPLGYGDCTPPDETDDTRPQCKHCLEHHNDDESSYCSPRCWHLDNIGEYKAQILLWEKLGWSDKIIEFMEKGEWFVGISEPSEKRWRRVINARFNAQKSRPELSQAA